MNRRDLLRSLAGLSVGGAGGVFTNWLIHSRPDETLQEWEDRGKPKEEERPMAVMKGTPGTLWVDGASIYYADQFGDVRRYRGEVVHAPTSV